MKQKSPHTETVLGIAFAILGIIFVIQGFNLVGFARIAFIACGLVDFVLAYTKLKPLWMKK
ncbi:MAG: hypothetical protein R3Y56_02670 [Akkermansia sp.]